MTNRSTNIKSFTEDDLDKTWSVSTFLFSFPPVFVFLLPRPSFFVVVLDPLPLQTTLIPSTFLLPPEPTKHSNNSSAPCSIQTPKRPRKIPPSTLATGAAKRMSRFIRCEKKYAKTIFSPTRTVRSASTLWRSNRTLIPDHRSDAMFYSIDIL